MEQIKTKIISLLEESYSLRINNLEMSIELATNALLLCNNSKYNDLKAKAYSRLSLYFMIIGRYDESYNLSQKSIHLYENLNDEIGIAIVKYNLAGFYYKTNDFQMGVVNLIDSLIIFKKHNDYHNISKCEKSLGSIYDFTGDEQKAIQSFKNAIKAAKKASDLNLESNARNNLAGIYLRNSNIELAFETIRVSIATKIETKDTRGLAFAIYGRAKIYYAQKEYEKAESDFFEAIAIHLKMGEKFGLAMAYNKLAKLYFEIERIKEAKKYIKLGLEICNFYNISLIRIKLLYLNYSIHKYKNNIKKTLHFLEIYLLEKEAILNSQNIKLIENYDLLVRMQTMQKESEFQQEKTKLINKNNKTEQAARVRQEFLSTMSHEIRTPLNAVTTIATLLSEKSNNEDAELIDSLKFSSNHLMQIINDILDFTKLDLGKMSLDLQPTKLRFYLDNFWNTYKIQAKDKKINLIVEIDPNLSHEYFIDQTKLTQILGNLLNNAIKFTDEGTINLDVKITKQSDDFDSILFKVIDTGVGIEKENLELIFESFSQLKNGITRKKDGAGLGLSISKKLVELYDSTIIIESVFGNGSCFSFELNLKKCQNKQQINEVVSSKNLNGIKVLLAEDNAINAMIAIKLLSKWGIITDHVINGILATEKSQEKKYNFILMDIHMPVLDGFEAAKNIRTLKNLNTETPIYALTADISAKDNTQYNFYFTDFLLKPLEIEKLKLALNS